MGKYNNSDLHQRFSDWHYQKCIKNTNIPKNATMTDVDRLWIEERDLKIVMAMELKYSTEPKGGSLTMSQKVMQLFFEEHGVPFVIVKIKTDKTKKDLSNWIDFKEFELIHKASGFQRVYSEEGFIEIINNLKNFSEELKERIPERTPEKLSWDLD